MVTVDWAVEDTDGVRAKADALRGVPLDLSIFDGVPDEP